MSAELQSSAKFGAKLAAWIRDAFFFAVLFLPGFALTALNFRFLSHSFPLQPNQQTAGSVLALGLFVWAHLWLFFFLNQCLLPLLILLIFGHEKERSPKRIIQIGERFRKMGLSSPQVILLSRRHPFLGNRLWGFFAVPSPFGAMLPLNPELAQIMEPDEINTWLCTLVTTARFFRFSSPLWMALQIATLTATAGGCVSAQWSLGAWPPTLALVGGAVAWVILVRLRNAAIWRKTRHDFELPAAELSTVLEKIQLVGPPLAQRLRRLWIRTFGPVNENFRLDEPVRSWSWLATGLPMLMWAIVAIVVFVQNPDFAGQNLNRPLASTPIPVTPQEIPKVSEVTSPTVQPPVVVQTPASTAAVEPTPASEAHPAAAVTPSPAATEVAAPKVTTPPTAAGGFAAAVRTGDLRETIRGVSRGENARVARMDLDGATALLFAVRAGDLEMVYVLSSLGSSLATEKDLAGRGSLFYAAQSTDRKRVFDYVLSVWPKTGIPEDQEILITSLAKEKGWTDILQSLQVYHELHKPTAENLTPGHEPR